jgi:hypothetical protein
MVFGRDSAAQVVCGRERGRFTGDQELAVGKGTKWLLAQPTQSVFHPFAFLLAKGRKTPQIVIYAF